MTDSEQLPMPRYTLSDDGEFLCLRWAPGVTLEAEDIRSTIAAVTSASPRGKRPLLVHIGLVEHISPEAKQLLIDDTCSSRTAVVGVDEVGRVLTAFNYRSATPSRYFTEESDAIAWLKGDTVPAGDPAPEEPFTAGMRGEVLWLDCGADADVDNTIATAIVRCVSQLSPLVCPPMIIRLNHLISVTEEALHTLATGLDIAALAIVGAEAEDSVITAYYKQQHDPPYPTRHFPTIDDAEAWLAHCFQRGPE